MTTHPTPASVTADDCGCADFAVSRRGVLRSAVGLGGGAAVSQLFGDSMLQASFGATTSGNVLVVISLRGGIDGLGVVVPHGDPGYYSARPTTAVPAASVICKDAMFGLHPAMAPLTPYWQSGELAAIQAVGLPAVNRSHFAAMEEVEDADPGSSARVGWINRMVGLGGSSSPFEAVQIAADNPSTALAGPAPTLAARSLAGLQVTGLDGYADQRYRSLDTIWSAARTPLAAGARDAVAISQGPGRRLASPPTTAVDYPTVWTAKPFAAPLKAAAQLIKSDVGTDVVAIDAGSWDFHANYGNASDGLMTYGVDGFARSLRAFLDDLGELRSRVTVVTISEFGRRIAENGSRGFDHGWANMMLVAGGGVRGGRYYGSWPTLSAAALKEGDLKVTTDYRTVLGEIVSRRFPDRSLAQLFPGATDPHLGFMQAA